MAYRLKNARVLFISVVKDPATGRQFLFKSADGQPAFEGAIEFRKADDARQVVYGVAYPAGSPDRVDAHGDFATADDVRAMAEDFMRTGRVIAGIDRDHDYRPIEAFVAESWIVRKGDPLFGDPADEGAWAVGVKITSKSLYDEFKNTGYRGFSIAGTAERVEIAKSETHSTTGDGWLKRFLKSIGKETDMSEDVKAAVEALTQLVKEQGAQIAKLAKGDAAQPPPAVGSAGFAAAPGVEKTDVEKAIEKALAPMLAKIDALEKAGKPDPKAIAQKALDDAIAAGDLDAIKKAHEALGKTQGGETETVDETDPVKKALADITAKVDALAKAKPGSAQVDATDGANGAVQTVKSIGIL